MGKSHENQLDVLLELSRYTGVNESFVTVNDLHTYMRDSYDVSDRTVRRCLDTLEDKGFVESREVGNTTAYVVVHEDVLPDVDKIFP